MSDITPRADATIGFTPTVSGGHACAKCFRFVEHGSTHRVLTAEKRCLTILPSGHEISHYWDWKPPARSNPHATNHMSKHSVKPLVPHRHSRSVLENAARELAGVNGHLEIYRHHEDEEYVTVELIVRKDRA